MRNINRLYAVPILAAFLYVLHAGTPAYGRSDVGVNLNVNLGPPPVIGSPPSELVLIPGTGIYFIPDREADIFFYGGYWWAPRGPRWYRAYAPHGPWVIVRRRSIPAPLFRVPHDYRVVYRGGERIPYGQWKKMHHGHRRDDRHDRDGRHDRW